MLHPAMHPGAINRLDGHGDQPVIQQQDIPDFDVLRQCRVTHADTITVARRQGVPGVEHESVTGGQLHTTGFEALDTDFRALQVGQQSDFAVKPRRHLAHQGGSSELVLCRTVRHVETEHIGAGENQPFHHLRIVGGRPEGGDDLGAARVAGLVTAVKIHGGDYKCI